MSTLSDLNWYAKFYKGLLGRNVTVTNNIAKPVAGQKSMVAWYTTEAGNLVGVLRVDVSLSILISSALCLMPPPTAQAAAKAGKLDDRMAEDLYEALNISSRFFQRVQNEPIVIAKVAPAEGPLPDNVKAMLKASPQRQELSVNIDGYGTGTITVASL